jgi:hypothetical protein
MEVWQRNMLSYKDAESAETGSPDQAQQLRMLVAGT